MKFAITLHHKHETVLGKRPLPFMGYLTKWWLKGEAEPPAKTEHLCTEEFKAQVEDDITWAFGVADKGINAGQEASAEGDRPRNLNAAYNRTGLAVRIFDELRRWRWNAMPGEPNKPERLERVRTLVELAGAVIHKEEAAAEGDEPEAKASGPDDPAFKKDFR